MKVRLKIVRIGVATKNEPQKAKNTDTSLVCFVTSDVHDANHNNVKNVVELVNMDTDERWLGLIVMRENLKL